MSVLNTLPAPVIQMSYVEKIVDQQQNQPHALMQAGQEAAREARKAEAQRIAGTEPTEHGRKVRERNEDRGRGRQNNDETGRRGASQTASQHTAADETELPDAGHDADEPKTPKANPWAGNIVNVKI